MALDLWFRPVRRVRGCTSPRLPATRWFLGCKRWGMAGATPRPAPREPGEDAGQPPPPRVDRPAQGHPDWLRLAIVRVAAYAVLVNTLLALHSRYLEAGWVPDWTIAATVLLLGAPSGLIVVRALQQRPDLRPARALVMTAIATNVLMTLAPHNGAPPAGTPFVNGSTVVAACLAAVSFRGLRRGVWWIAALCLSYAALRSPAVGWPVGLLEASVTAVGSISVGLFTEGIAAVFTGVERAEADRAAAREAAIVHEQRERSRREWDRLVHDKVLGALTTASRSTTFDELLVARTLAADALRALGVIETRADRSSSLQALGARFGVRVMGDDLLPNGLPDDVVDAVMAAAAEGFANIARHADTDVAHVQVAGGPGEVTVRIRDDGAGFDTDASPTRFGLGRSVPGHMADIGGSGIVESTVGVGTTVTLTWRREPQDDATTVAQLDVHDPQRWPRSLVVLPPAWVTLNVMLGWASTRELFAGGVLGWPLALWCGAALILVSVLLAGRTTAWAAPTALVVSAVAVGGLAVLTPSGQAADWRLWFSAATLPLPVLFALSGRERAAWAYAVLNPLAIAAGLSVHGATSVFSVPEVLLAPWIVTVPSVIAMRALRRAWADVRTASEETLALRQADHTLALASAAARQRRDELSRNVIPLLTRLWREDVFDAGDRLEATLAEAAVRDRLVAGALVDDDLARAVDNARTRGARVDLRAAAHGDDHGLLTRFRNASSTLLSLCGEDSRATIHWHPRDESSLGTVAIIDPRSKPDLGALSRALDGVPHVLEHEHDEVWLSLTRLRQSVSPEGGTAPTEHESPEEWAANVGRVHEDGS